MRSFALAASVAIAVTAPPALGSPLVPIFDARQDSRPREMKDEERARLERVVFARGTRKGRFCDGGEQREIVDVARGAFTRPGTKQQAVLYRLCWIGRLPHEQGIAVVEAGRVVADISYVGRDFAIRALPDLDGNGLSEILVYESADGQGHSYGGVYLLELPPKDVRWIGYFPVAHDDCGAVDSGKETAAVLFASPGPKLSFFKEELTRRCETRPWRKSKAQVPVRPRSGKRQSYLRLR